MNVFLCFSFDNGHNVALTQSLLAATVDVTVHLCLQDLREWHVILKSPLHFF